MVDGSQVALSGVVSFHWTNTSLMVHYGDDALAGPRIFVNATRWNLLHPTQGD
jgi:hypothetical protein